MMNYDNILKSKVIRLVIVLGWTLTPGRDRSQSATHDGP